jgi:glutamate formiminotransferase
MRILQCVPNFSEGRDPRFLQELEAVLGQYPVKTLDLSMDADHNRADCTFLGAPDAVEECAAALTARAVELIDMRQHGGSHPRMGAVDVVPFVPIRGMTMADAVEIAHRFGRSFAERHGIPVFFYEEACTSEERRNLADVRRGEYEGMAAKLQDPAWVVDAGPQTFNERSGVTAVGARMPLIAFNVNLDTDDLSVAKSIASAVRHSSGGLRYVKAMGVEVAEKGVVQVSMNLVDYRRTPIHRALELVRIEAARYGVAIRESELVGLVPLEALGDAAGYYLQVPDFDAAKVIEYHLLPEDGEAAS